MTVQLSVDQIRRAVETYRAKSSDGQATAQLRMLRMALTEFLLAADAGALPGLYAGAAGDCLRMIVDSGIRDEPLLPEDAPLVSQIQRGLKEAAWERYGLAAMLHLRASQLESPHLDPTAPPPWLARDWLSFLLEAPPYFTELGLADAHARHSRRVLEYLHERIMARPDDPQWRDVAKAVVARFSIGQLYFSDENMGPAARMFADILESRVRAQGSETDHWFGPRPAGRPIRMGVIGQHFQAETGPISTLALFNDLDRSKFELFFYVQGLADTPAQRVCLSRAARVTPINENVAEIVARLREDDLDLLLFVANLATRDGMWMQLAAHRMARVQLANFVSPASTGSRHIDYFISGTLSEPPDAQEQYRERLVLLEGAGFCYDLSPHRAQDAAAPPAQTSPVTRQILGIDPQTIIYASGANFYKLTPELLHTWARILAGVPGSALLLFPFARAWGDSYPAEMLYKQLDRAKAAYGAGAARVIVAPPLPGRAVVASVLREMADVYLDSFPHSGANSLLDVLEVGLPAVTLYGKTLRGRHGGGMMMEMGVTEGVTESVDAYVELAVRLGRDRAARMAMREKIEAAMARGPRFLDTGWHGQQCAALYERFIADWENAAARP